MADNSDTMEHGKNAKVPHRRDRRKTIAMCVRINRWRKSLAYFADAQIFRDRRIKSPSVSPAETINPSCSPSHLRIKDRQTAQKKKKKQQLISLGNKIGVPLQSVFTSQKIGDVLKSRELKPNIISQQCVVYRFKCGPWDMGYVEYTNRHLDQRVVEHSSLNSSTGKHTCDLHGIVKPN